MKRCGMLNVLIVVLLIGFGGLAEAVNLNNFAITTDKYSETVDLEQIVMDEFGSNYRIATWDDLINYYDDGGTAVDFEENLTGSAMITYNGSHWYRSTRHYFYSISHRPGQTPHSGYLSDANIDNHEFDLGSWYGLNQHILVYTNSPSSSNCDDVGYDAGYKAGRQACIDDPASCGISTGGGNCESTASYDIWTGVLTIPNLMVGSDSWNIELEQPYNLTNATLNN